MDLELDLNSLLDMLEQGLPMLVADDDFIEYMRECSYEECSSVELDELIDMWEDWSKENVE